MSNQDVVGGQPTDQHYYHFVVARDRRGFSLESYWNALAIGARSFESVPDREAERFVVQRGRLVLNQAYAGGELLREISESGNGAPPYGYDLFGLRWRSAGSTLFALGFPFSKMAKEYVGRLIGDHRLLQVVDLQKADVASLVRCCEEAGAISGDQGLQLQVVDVQFLVVGDPNVSDVRLGGVDPLRARIYKERLKGEIAKRYLRPNQCVVLCELPGGAGATDGTGRALRARLHIDGFGNFKCYTHKIFANLPVLGRSIASLQKLKCLDKTSQNPLDRVPAD